MVMAVQGTEEILMHKSLESWQNIGRNAEEPWESFDRTLIESW